MSDRSTPLVSFVMATHERRSVVERTLGEVRRCGLARDEYKIIVVDNASRDGTPEAIEAACDHLIRLRSNRGSCAKAFALPHVSAPYVVFLDDDSFPWPGVVARMVEHFEREPALGAAGFRVHLPDGREEGAALPHVFVGCGVAFRTEALRAVGGLDATFFMQAEEYDLAFRLGAAGWGVRVFDDLHVTHLKTPRARRSERTTYLDVRNNLRVIARYLPEAMAGTVRADLLTRYLWLAERHGHMRAFPRGVAAGLIRGLIERRRYRSRRLSPALVERFYRWGQIGRRMKDLAAGGVRRIVLAGLGKNIYPFHRGAAEAGVAVVAIGDDRFAAEGRKYRGTPVVPLQAALGLEVDAAVVADTAPVHAAAMCDRLRRCAAVEVYHWPAAADGSAASRWARVVDTTVEASHPAAVAVVSG